MSKLSLSYLRSARKLLKIDGLKITNSVGRWVNVKAKATVMLTDNNVGGSLYTRGLCVQNTEESLTMEQHISQS